MGLLIGGCGVFSLRNHRALTYHRFDRNNDMRVIAIASGDGSIWLFNDVYRRTNEGRFAGPGWYFGPSGFGWPQRNWWRPYYLHYSGPDYDQKNLILPHWLVAVFFFTLGLPFILRMRNYLRWRNRLRRGRCPGCGFDLRASPERCPECGRLKEVA
jgi:hypothetical protein